MFTNTKDPAALKNVADWILAQQIPCWQRTASNPKQSHPKLGGFEIKFRPSLTQGQA